MQTLEFVKGTSRNCDLKQISGLVKAMRFPIDAELVKGILFELVCNAKKYGEGGASVRLDDDERYLSIAVVNDGGFGAAGEQGKKEILNKILRHKEMENYGIYGIIKDVTARSGRMVIRTSGLRFTFGTVCAVERAARDGKVAVEIEFRTENDMEIERGVEWMRKK